MGSKAKPHPIRDVMQAAKQWGRCPGQAPYINPIMIEDCIRAAKLAKQEDCVLEVDARHFSNPERGNWHAGLDPNKVHAIIGSRI